MEWISVKDSLPESGQLVWVMDLHYKHKWPESCQIFGVEWQGEYGLDNDFSGQGSGMYFPVGHMHEAVWQSFDYWMPADGLPKPPENFV